MKPMYFYRAFEDRGVMHVTDWHPTYEEAHKAGLDLDMHRCLIQTIRIPVTKANVLALLNGTEVTGTECSITGGE